MVGTLLAARRPRNPIGWMLLAFYFLAIAPAGDYAIIDYRLHHGHLPLGSVAVVVLASWPVWLVLIANLLWVFPDGRLPQGRWAGWLTYSLPVGRQPRWPRRSVAQRPWPGTLSASMPAATWSTTQPAWRGWPRAR